MLSVGQEELHIIFANLCFCESLSNKWYYHVYIQLVVWAIDQKRTDELQKEMQNIKVPFRMMEESGQDGKGTIKRWSQPQGGLYTCVIVHCKTVLSEHFITDRYI